MHTVNFWNCALVCGSDRTGCKASSGQLALAAILHIRCSIYVSRQSISISSELYDNLDTCTRQQQAHRLHLLQCCSDFHTTGMPSKDSCRFSQSKAAHARCAENRQPAAAYSTINNIFTTINKNEAFITIKTKKSNFYNNITI